MINLLQKLLTILIFTAGILVAQTIVEPGNGTLGSAIENGQPGDVLQLEAGGVYTHSGSASFAQIGKPLTIQVEPGATQKAIIRLADSASVSSKYYFFMIMDGASLTMRGLDIHGMIGDSTIAMSMIKFDGRPDPTQLRVGTIRFEDCFFHDFQDNIVHGMTESTMKGMHQDSLFIDNVIVYNADAFLQYKHPSLYYMELKNSTMFKLRSMALKIGKERYRGYTRISPVTLIDHCTFDDMGGDHGHIQIDDAFFPVTVSNCIISNIQKDNIQPGLFMNDPQIDTAVTVINTCFWKSGPPVSLTEPCWPGYVFHDSISLDPEYRDAAGGDFALPANSLLATYASDGGQVGDPRWGTYTISDLTGTNAEFIAGYQLQPNYPNPFNPETTIRFSLPGLSSVVIEVFDLSGRLVANLVNDSRPAGTYTVVWNAINQPSGIYMFQMTVGNFKQTRKAMLLH